MGASDQVVRQFEKRILLFDGVCNLCNGVVQFVIRRDNQDQFLFASLQSKFGQQQLKDLGLNTTELQTIVLLKDGQMFQRSDAALEIAKDLGGLWPFFYCFKIFPRVIRDAVYNLISRNRYKWFGKRESCMIPTESMRSKFID